MKLILLSNLNAFFQAAALQAWQHLCNPAGAQRTQQLSERLCDTRRRLQQFLTYKDIFSEVF